MGETEVANDALQRLAAQTIAGADWADGIEARGERFSASAKSLSLGTTNRSHVSPARRSGSSFPGAHLLYGEWLRRENRRVDDRQQLRVAHESFAAMGAEAFAEACAPRADRHR